MYTDKGYHVFDNSAPQCERGDLDFCTKTQGMIRVLLDPRVDPLIWVGQSYLQIICV